MQIRSLADRYLEWLWGIDRSQNQWWSEDKIARTSGSKTITSGKQKHSHRFIRNQSHEYLSESHDTDSSRQNEWENENEKSLKKQQPKIKDQIPKVEGACKCANELWNEESVRASGGGGDLVWFVVPISLSLTLSITLISLRSENKRDKAKWRECLPQPALLPPSLILLFPTGTISVHAELVWKGATPSPVWSGYEPSPVVWNRETSQFGNREMGASIEWRNQNGLCFAHSW